MSKKRRAAPRPRPAEGSGPPAPAGERPATGPARPRSRTGSTPSRGRRSAPPPRRSGRTALLVGGGAIIAVLAIAAIVLGQGSGKTAFDAPKSATPRPLLTAAPGESTAAGPVTIDGVTCDPQEHISYHVHSHLTIRVDGQTETIPSDVGRTATCLFWLHTHATLGVIHVEAPARRSFTLGQFFAVWGKPLTTAQVADWPVPSGSRVWVVVDGQPIDVDPASIELTNLRTIELQIGPTRLDPLGYDWPAEYR